MEQHKVRTYLLYAIGEIFLVVVGILIALQVNNWNIERNQEQEAIQVLTDMEKAIEGYIFTGVYLSPMVQLDSVHYHILNKSLQPDLFENSKLNDAESLLRDPMDVVFTSGLGWLYNENVNTILENERLFPEQFSRILFMVQRLNSAFQNMEILTSEMRVLQEENLKYLSTKEWLYLLDEESFKERIEFFHSDTYFRNRLRRFNELNSRFIQQYDIWEKFSLFAWIEFQMVVREKTFIDLTQELETFGYERAAEVPCTDEIVKDPVHTFYFWHVVYNNTSEPVDLYSRDLFTKKRRPYKTLQPGEFDIRFTNNDFPYLQIGKNNTCERQYATGWESFIVIDP